MPLDSRELFPSSIHFFQVKTLVINTFLQLYFIELSISPDALLEGGGELSATTPEKSNEIREFIARALGEVTRSPCGGWCEFKMGKFIKVIINEFYVFPEDKVSGKAIRAVRI